MQLGSHPPEICPERRAFCYTAGFWAGAHLSEFPKGSGVGDIKIESAISSLKLVLELGRDLAFKLEVSRYQRSRLSLEDCRFAIGFRLSSVASNKSYHDKIN